MPLCGGVSPLQRLFAMLYVAMHAPEVVWLLMGAHVANADAALLVHDNGVVSFLLASLCGVVGVVFYVTHIPERWWPGRFDFGVHSHVIWHLWTGACANM